MNTNKCFWLTSHNPTPEQVKDLEVNFGVSEENIIRLPEELQKQFSNVPSTLNENDVSKLGVSIIGWITDNLTTTSNIVVVQGHFGLTYSMIIGLNNIQLASYYAVSDRVSIEEKQSDGSVKKTSVFKHCKFLKYV